VVQAREKEKVEQEHGAAPAPKKKSCGGWSKFRVVQHMRFAFFVFVCLFLVSQALLLTAVRALRAKKLALLVPSRQ
jgi:hypothetical protein